MIEIFYSHIHAPHKYFTSTTAHRFKYILIRVSINGTFHSIILRGGVRFGYHRDILNYSQEVVPHYHTTPENVTLECVGGGRIEHNPQHKELHVFGYSTDFGAAPHELSAELLKRMYPFYESITCNYEGY